MAGGELVEEIPEDKGRKGPGTQRQAATDAAAAVRAGRIAKWLVRKG
jgi:hypothetical protein